MASLPKTEVWLRGPLNDMPVLLQPAAHALLQAREELYAITLNLPETLLWYKPYGLASAGFHLQHLTGVLDRLFTYAKGNQLSPQQLEWLSAEGKEVNTEGMVALLVGQFNQQVDKALQQLRNTDEQTLTQPREVGRQKLPSTVIGLLVHAAEHTQRHIGQLLVTVRVLSEPGFEKDLND